MFIGRAKAGTTLIEALICGGLSLLLLSILYNLMVASRYYLDNAESKSAIQTQLLKAVRKISREVVESNRFAISAEGSALVFASPRDSSGRVHFDGQGRLLWTRMITYYLADEGLIRKAQAVEPPASEPPSPPAFEGLRDNPDLPSQQIARYIKVFLPTVASDGTMTYTMRAELKLKMRTFAVEIEEKVLPRN